MLTDLEPGLIFEDRYAVIEKISEGGFGTLYKARHVDMDRLVAIKILNPELLGDKENRARFKIEGRILAELIQPNIVQFFHFGMLADRQSYIVMEYLDGHSLRQVLQTGGRLSADRVLAIALQLCEGLEAAHEKGIIHRDLKPNNIMVMDCDLVKLIDFGLSRVLVSSSVSVTEHLTKTGLLIGSVNYMSPEQCCGKNADQRSDIYSLGCILYEALTGREPFEADNPMGLLHKHLVAVPTPLAEKGIQLPRGLDVVIEKALEKNPDSRYQKASDMKRDLNMVQQGKGALILRSSPKESTGRPSQRSWGIVSMICIVALTLLATMYISDRSRPGPQMTAPYSTTGVICYLDVRSVANSRTAFEVKEVHLTHEGNGTGSPEKFVGAISVEGGRVDKLQVGKMCACHQQDGKAIIKFDESGADYSGAVRCLFDFLKAVDKGDLQKALEYVDCLSLHGGRYDLEWLKQNMAGIKLRKTAINEAQETLAVPDLTRLSSRAIKIQLCKDECVHIIVDRSIMLTKDGKPIGGPMIQRFILVVYEGKWIIRIIGSENNLKDMEAWDKY